MTIDRINPPELHVTPGYHHVTVVRSSDVAFLAGQCPLRPDGTIVGVERGPRDTDLTIAVAQTDQIVENTLLALAAVGVGADRVVKTVIYVASGDRDVLVAVWDRLNESALAAAFSSASTLVGVACLGFPGQLVELDVTAALGS
jgi:enamine deaminase RidA (YjgF/YER057c/UK114 family)